MYSSLARSVGFLSLFLGLAVFSFSVPTAEANNRMLAYFFRSNTGQQLAHSAATPEFDVRGPGSTPLSGAVENRLMRYVSNDHCPQTLDSALNERCQFLLKLSRHQSAQSLMRTRKVLQSRGLLQTGLVTHTIQEFEQGLRDLNPYLRLQEGVAGRSLRPRTLEQAGAAFGEAVKRQRGVPPAAQ